MEQPENRGFVTEGDAEVLKFLDKNKIVTPDLAARQLDLDEDYALYACRNLYRDGLLDREVGEYYRLSEFGHAYLENSPDPTGMFEKPTSQVKPCSVSIVSIIEDVTCARHTSPMKFRKSKTELWLSVATQNVFNEHDDDEIIQEVLDRSSRLFGLLSLKRLKSRIDELNQTIQFILNDYSSEEIVNPFDDEKQVSLDADEWESVQLSIQATILIDNLINFYNLLTELLKIVCSNLIVSEFTDRLGLNKMDVYNQIYSDWSQHQRETFLRVIGAIEQEQQQQASRLRTRRNSLIHDISTRFWIDDVNKGISDMKAGIDLIDELTALAEEGAIH